MLAGISVPGKLNKTGEKLLLVLGCTGTLVCFALLIFVAFNCYAAVKTSDSAAVTVRSPLDAGLRWLHNNAACNHNYTCCHCANRQG